MHDSTDDSAGDVRGRAASESAIDGSGPHAGGGGEREVDDVHRKVASIRRILGQSALMLDFSREVRLVGRYPSGRRRTILTHARFDARMYDLAADSALARADAAAIQ